MFENFGVKKMIHASNSVFSTSKRSVFFQDDRVLSMMHESWALLYNRLIAFANFH